MNLTEDVTLDFNFDTTDDVSICHLVIHNWEDKTEREFTGSSKRNPEDTPNKETAEHLSFARALKSAASYYNSLADNAVRQADRRREHEQRIKDVQEQKRITREFNAWMDDIHSKFSAPVFPVSDDEEQDNSSSIEHHAHSIAKKDHA